MKIAIVGSGIAGNVAAHYLNLRHDITVFEANDYVGGHTNTVDVYDAGRRIPVDTGFIVFNDRTYPFFNSVLEEIGQTSHRSAMSFSVRNRSTGLEYCGSTLNGLFAQRRNLVSPAFLRMVGDILRFNREAVSVMQELPAETTVGEYLEQGGYSAEFARDYLVPMTAAIWSAEPGRVATMPLGFLVRFFHNHGLLQLKDRPAWYVVDDGSRSYVTKLTRAHRDRIRLGTPVQSISRLGDHVQVKAQGCEAEQFDYVFLACHADQALDILADPTHAEFEVLSSIPYQRNEAVLHTDTALLPSRRRAWAAWNYHVPSSPQSRVSVTYNMNVLQGFDAAQQYCVTLNDSESIDPSKILYSVEYQHPVFGLDSIAAQARHREINTGHRTYYCGAYWRNGFHEDGVWSALQALDHFAEEQNAELPVRRAS